MFRKLLVVFAVLMLGVTAASAQSCQDIIDKRQSLMKKSGAAAKIVAPPSLSAETEASTC